METLTWQMDTAHSEVQFKVKHMMISTVTGYFKSFEGTAETTGDDFTSARIKFSADLDSISTNNEQRDNHLKSEDFFDASNHPKIHFTSTDMKKKSDEEYILSGDLSIRGTTHPIELKVEYGGMIEDQYGATRAGFTLDGKISRKAFGLQWNAVTESGGVVVADEVRIHINAEFVRQ